MNKSKTVQLLFAICLLSFSFTSCLSTKSSGSKTPHEMIKNNEIDAAKGQFLMPSDINGVDEDGNTVLHLAAQINDADLITFFMIKGADAELKNYESNTALHVAIENGCYDAAKALITMGANIFSRNANGITALDCAIDKDPEYYNIFVTTKTGEIRDTEGKSIVHYFVETHNPQGVEFCVNRKIPISVKADNGKTPLDLAFENIDNDDCVQIAAILIYGGAEQVETDFSYFQEALTSRNLSYRFDDGQTPLHFGSIFGHTAIVKYLLENNANFNAQDSSGNTPLHEAVRYGNVEIARMLLNAGANVNAKDNLGKTPILLVVPKAKMLDIYSFLISFKANLNAKDNGDSPLVFCV